MSLSRLTRRPGAAARRIVVALLAGALGILGGLILHEHHAGAQPAETTAAAPDADAGVRDALETVIRQQEAAWNRGDVDAFVDYYWRSDDLTFSSGGKMTRGWTATRDGYRERYPTREKMGQVKFSNLEITPLGDAAALVLGEWRLTRDEPIGGNFTLVFRKLDGRWLIIHDHTSRLAE